MLRALDGELGEAVEDLDALSRTLNHDDAVYADVEVALVVTLLNAGRADQALERLLKLEELTADDPHRRVATDDARALLGSSLASMGRFEDAQIVLTPFVPTLAEQPAAIRESAHFTLGEIDQASGRLESAIAHYEASAEAAQQIIKRGNQFLESIR